MYGAVTLARRFAYDHRLLRQERVDAFSVSVGGLEAGGSGKTPVTAALLRAFLADGRKVGLLTRGYGRSSRGLVLRAPGEPARAAELGDEPAMLVASGHDVHVAAVGRRILGARALVERGCDTLVLDDAFAHRAFGRDLDIVVLRGEAPFGNGHLLPWGTLRETVSSLRRAHIVWLHFRGAVKREFGSLQEYAPNALWVVSESVSDGVVSASGEPIDLVGARVLGAAGIARPSDFEATLRREGADLASFVSYPDHHVYRPADVRALGERATRAGCTAVVVTQKDAIKLGPLWQGPPLWTYRLGVRVVQGERELGARLKLRSSFPGVSARDT